jgi:hypothetical protein
LFAASTPSMALLNHFISSIWVQWLMLQCWEGSTFLNGHLDLPINRPLLGPPVGCYRGWTKTPLIRDTQRMTEPRSVSLISLFKGLLALSFQCGN